MDLMQKFILLLLVCSCYYCVTSTASPSPEGLSIALVGGGVASASTAFYLRELGLNGIDIHVYETQDQVGGRVRSIVESNNSTRQPLELGASIIYKGNNLVINMAQRAGLTVKEPSAGGTLLFALFNGRSLVFTQSPWSLITLIKLLWRYGFEYWRYKRVSLEMFQRFSTIYTRLDAGISYDRPHEMLRDMQLYDLTQMSFQQFIQETMKKDSLFAKEFVAGVGKTNYDQSAMELNALAGLVSLLPATDGKVVHIAEGNQQLVSRTLSKANVTVFTGRPVDTITMVDKGHFVINHNKSYDAVVITAPLQMSPSIKFEGVDLPRIPRRNYKQVRVTIVEGSIRPTYFGLPPGMMPYQEILITSDKWSEKLPFSSLSRIDLATPSVTSQHQLIDMKLGTYNLFSSEPIPKVWLSILFDEGFDVLHNLTWHAYPSFDPPENFPPFVFAPGLYYTAALESAASAMEIAAIEGRNVAMLCSQYLRQTGLYQRFGKQTY